MIADKSGSIEYEECGSGTTIVFVPGSCSTGSAWRPVIKHLGDGFRCVTTSLLGYGQTAERRTDEDPSIAHEAEIVETVIRKAGGRVHLVGHSFGGGVALIVALRKRSALASLTLIDIPAVEMLRSAREESHCRAVRQMTDRYFAKFEQGDDDAVATMVDFFAGEGTFATWPPRWREYAKETTSVNILDWKSGSRHPISLADLAGIEIPTNVICGGESHPALQRISELLAEHIPDTHFHRMDDAAHFMTGTHPKEVAELIGEGINRVTGARRDNDRDLPAHIVDTGNFS